jgi:ribose transport system substrate-binding protein
VFKDAQNDSLRQRAQVEELLAQGISLLVISPKESAPLTAPVARAYDQGIPVIVLDRRVDGDRFTTFIGPDNRRIGQAAGKWASAALGGKGKIVELEGLMTSSPARERHDGFWDGVGRAQHPGIEVVFTADTQWLEPNARREMESALAAHPHIDLVFAHNDPGAHGAYLAAKAVGREQEMKFVGIDALPHEGVQYVRDGWLDVTFAYSTCAREAIDTALAIRDKRPVPKEIIVGTRRFDASNVAQGGAAIE